MDLIALYIGDYLAGATDDLDRGWSDSFWPLEMREDDYSLVMLQDVPEDIAEQLLAQGTSEQWYDDGYDAASAAAPYLVGDGEEDEEDPEDEDEDEDDEYAEYNLYVWWDEEPSNPGWYVEVYDADQQVGDSMDDDFPVDVDEFGRDEADRLRKALEEAYSGAEIGGEVRGPSAEESTGPLLRDQPAFTWHRLAYHPDYKTPRGPTAFEASWHESTHGIEVTTRDEPGAPSHHVTDTGSGRRDRYLDTPIFIEEVGGRPLVSTGPSSVEEEEEWEEDYWYPDEDLRTWIDSIADPTERWLEVDLSPDGTPVYQSALTAAEVVASIPRHFVGTGGKSVMIEAKDGDVAVLMEDWLEGCIPSDLHHEALEEGYLDYYDRPDGGEEYCAPRAKGIFERADAKLDPNWEPVLEQVFEERATRFAWVNTAATTGGTKASQDWELTLETLCADDFGAGYRDESEWDEDDREHVANYEATRERHQLLEQLAEERGFATQVSDSDDRDSRHSDGYVYFPYSRLQEVVDLLEEIGLPGDVVDVPVNFPAESAEQLAALGWTVEWGKPEQVVSGLGGGRRTTNLKSRLLAAKRSVKAAKAEIELCNTPEEQRRVGAEECKRRIKNAKARIRRWEPFIEKVEPKPQNRSGGNAYDPEATENTFAGIKFQLVRTEGAGVRYWRVRNLTTGEDIEKPGHGTIFPGTTKREKWESIARTLRLIGEERFRQEL